jgi:hypothetical protein
LTTGHPAKGSDGSELYDSVAAVTAAPTTPPSGTLDAGTVACTGWGWLALDVVVEVEPIQLTIRRFVNVGGVWVLQMSAGFDGVLTVPVGSYGYNIQCLGADFVDVQFSSRGAGGNGTVSVNGSLSQEG